MEPKGDIYHYGVKGMRWGVRKQEATGVEVTTKPGQRVRAKGGTNQPASEDAIRTARIRQQAKKSTTDSLSNKELQDLVTRMNLEQQYQRLDPKRQSVGMKIAKAIATNPTYSGVAVGLLGVGLAKYGDELPGAAASAAKFGLKIATNINKGATHLAPLNNNGGKKKK